MISHICMFLMGSLVFVIYTHAGAKAQDTRAPQVESPTRLLPSHAFPSLLFLQCLLSVSLDPFRHARIDSCAQHSRGVVRRHDSLVHVRLTGTVCNTLLQNLTEPGRPSSIYGITLLQVYSYYNNHCSRDRWPLKFFVSVLH